ncbi:MAG: flagellar brake domain-containing protein, partial [Bacillota bacterium]
MSGRSWCGPLKCTRLGKPQLGRVATVEFEDILVVNRNITLVVPEGRNAGRYPSRIEDVGADAVVVAAPTRKGAVLRLSEGD